MYGFGRASEVTWEFVVVVVSRHSVKVDYEEHGAQMDVAEDYFVTTHIDTNLDVVFRAELVFPRPVRIRPMQFRGIPFS